MLKQAQEPGTPEQENGNYKRSVLIRDSDWSNRDLSSYKITDYPNYRFNDFIL